MVRDITEYDPERALWIAGAYAEAEMTMKELADEYPKVIPGVLWIRRWRGQHPEFDMLMMEAERCRAEILADEIIKISDDPDRIAAAAGNAIKSRQWMAARLDRKRYGSETTVKQEISGIITHDHLHALTDDQLMSIAAGHVIDGEATRTATEPAAITHKRT